MHYIGAKNKETMKTTTLLSTIGRTLFLIVVFAAMIVLSTGCSKSELVSPVEIETFGMPKSNGSIDFVNTIDPCSTNEVVFEVEDLRISDAPPTFGELEITTTVFLYQADPNIAQIKLDGVQKSIPPVLNVTLQFCSPDPFYLLSHLHTQNVNIQPLIDSLGYTNDAVDIRINGGYVFQLQDAQPIQPCPAHPQVKWYLQIRNSKGNIG